ncbi:hypothetical protein BC827DRAFT_1383913 [Russula dissimulans]|nr:hypothetical protein BC827DRAFT_1383913 [Russula dissimulans]
MAFQTSSVPATSPPPRRRRHRKRLTGTRRRSQRVSAPPPTAEPSDPAAKSARPSAAAASNRRWSLPLQFSLLRRVRSSPLTSNKHDAAADTPAASPDPAPAPAPPPVPPIVPAPVLSSADRRAQKSALLVRSLIVGQNADEGGLASPQKAGMSSAQLKNVKTQLLEPKTAGKILAQLRALPALSNSAYGAGQHIRAVCLPYLDEEADKLHLSHLNFLQDVKSTAAAAATATKVTTDTEKTHPLSLTPVAGAVEAVTKVLRDSHVVSLFSAPNMGLGQPGDGPGLLAGALPTAETVVSGIEKITPQLMALSYATGHPAIPEHKGVYPPTDRMSILTSWWGFELLLPPPTLAYLNGVESKSKTVLNILTVLGGVNEGVREILPFARYIAQYVDFEFNEINSQDQGKGVICTATWIMPIAMIPRPWDFSDPPKTLQPGLNGQAVSPPSNEAPASPASPLPTTQSPAPTPA